MIESYSVSGRSRRLPTALGRPAIFEERKERYHDNIPILYHCDHCGLSGRHGAGGGLLQPEGRGLQLPRVLPGRPQTGSHRHRHERRGFGHEQLPAHGSARPGLPVRRGRGGLDRHRGQAPAPVLGQDRRHHHPRLLFPAVPGPAQRALLHRRGGDPDLLHPLHRLRLQGHRHPVQQPVRRGLPRGHDHRRHCGHRLHGAGRLFGRVHHRPDPEHHYDLCPDLHRPLRHPAGRGMGTGGRQCQLPARLPELHPGV